MPQSERRYSPEEMRQILQRAQRAAPAEVAASGADAGLTRAELIETATEVGFSPEQVQTALVRYEEDRRIEAAQHELRVISYRRFSAHLIWFLLVNAVITGCNLWLGAPYWFFIPLVLWGALLLFHLRGVLLPDPDRLRERARSRLAQRRLKESSRQFGSALSHGAARLLAVTAQKIEEGSSRLGKGP